MNTQTKVILTILGIPGAVQKIKSVEKKKATIDLGYPKGKKKISWEEKVYESCDCSQKMNISYEAYLYMTGPECPSFIKPKIWQKMTRRQKLEAHLQRTCDYLNGKDFSYVILED